MSWHLRDEKTPFVTNRCSIPLIVDLYYDKPYSRAKRW
jgi:hypothetical protein